MFGTICNTCAPRGFVSVNEDNMTSRWAEIFSRPKANGGCCGDKNRSVKKNLAFQIRR